METLLNQVRRYVEEREREPVGRVVVVVYRPDGSVMDVADEPSCQEVTSFVTA